MPLQMNLLIETYGVVNVLRFASEHFQFYVCLCVGVHMVYILFAGMYTLFHVPTLKPSFAD